MGVEVKSTRVERDNGGVDKDDSYEVEGVFTCSTEAASGVRRA